MNMFHFFLGEFWLVFLPFTVVFAAVWVGRMISLDGTATSLSPKHFAVLNGFTKDEQKRLLHAADRKAFPGWCSIVPVLIYSILVSISVAAAGTFRKVGMVPDSWWIGAGVTFLLIGSGGWVIRRLEAHRIRRFLIFATKEQS